MAFTYMHVAVVIGVAFAAIIAVLVTAPNVTAGTHRLMLISKTVRATILIVAGMIGASMMFWGFRTNSEPLIWNSLFPLIIAGMALSVGR